MCVWNGASVGRQPLIKTINVSCPLMRTGCLNGAPCLRSITHTYSADLEVLGGASYSTLKLIRIPSGPVCGNATPIESRTDCATALTACDGFEVSSVVAGDAGDGDGKPVDEAEAGGDAVEATGAGD